MPAISVTGSEEWLGEWTFSLSMGSMSDEPIFWTDLIAKRGIDNVGVLVEQSLVGEQLRRSSSGGRAEPRASASWPRSRSPRRPRTSPSRCSKLHDAGVDAVVHCGFGFGVVLVGFAMQALGWDPPRFMGTAFQNAWLNEIVWNAMVGWTGIDQYDAANQVGQEFLDRYDERFGRRPEWCVPVVNRDLAVGAPAGVRRGPPAVARGRPRRPRAGEDVPGRLRRTRAPGSRSASYMHRGWMGPGYLVARQLDPDGVTAHTVDRFGERRDVRRRSRPSAGRVAIVTGANSGIGLETAAALAARRGQDRLGLPERRTGGRRSRRDRAAATRMRTWRCCAWTSATSPRSPMRPRRRRSGSGRSTCASTTPG